MTSQSLDAIIVTYRTGPRLKECLHALAAHKSIKRLIIIDNGNPPAMTDWIEAFAARVEKARYEQTGVNLGFGRAVNRGVALSRAEQVLIINPDCVIRPDAIAPLQDAARALPSPWIVGGRIFDVRGIAQRGPQRRELTLGRILSKIIGGQGINMPLSPQPEHPVAVDVTSGAFFLMDRAGFEQIDGFDEAYFLHVEDIDLCKRVHDVGGAVIYQPHAGALHFGATSDVSSLFVERHKAAGFARYLRKFSKGPFHRMMVELCLPVITALLLFRAWLKPH